MPPTTYPSRSGAVTGAGHDEWLVDEAIDDTFPASDPVSHGQPGSIVNVRYAALERRARRQGYGAATPWAIAAAAVAACAAALVLSRKRRTRSER
jgi:hypothetical protein